MLSSRSVVGCAALLLSFSTCVNAHGWVIHAWGDGHEYTGILPVDHDPRSFVTTPIWERASDGPVVGDTKQYSSNFMACSNNISVAKPYKTEMAPVEAGSVFTLQVRILPTSVDIIA
jgi:hypothetical protein